LHAFAMRAPLCMTCQGEVEKCAKMKLDDPRRKRQYWSGIQSGLAFILD
jgi:hypothetical protein